MSGGWESCGLTSVIAAAVGALCPLGDQDRAPPSSAISSCCCAGWARCWSSASVALEFLFGHINKDSWVELLHAYDVLDGRLWLLDVLGIAAAPAAARAWRIRRHPDPGAPASWFRG